MNTKQLNGKPALEVEGPKENGALTVVKKKMTVNEKIDGCLKLEGLVSKVEYIRECKANVEKFGTGTDGFQGAKLELRCPHAENVVVSNPAIVEELLKTARMRLQEALIKCEKEIEDFQMI